MEELNGISMRKTRSALALNRKRNGTNVGNAVQSTFLVKKKKKIGHFRVAFCLGFKTSPSAEPFT